MSITLDDKAVDVFKLYDEMAIAYSKDIEGYKAHIVAIEAMIAQKEEMLRDIRDKTVALVKTSLEIIPSHETPVRKKRKKHKDAGVDVVEALAPEKEIEAGEVVEVQSLEVIPPVPVKRTRSANRKKTSGKGKVKEAEKSKKPAKRSDKIAEAKPPRSKKSEKPAKTETEIKCLYHPESPASDKGRQLCKSCNWKLIYSGLKNYDKDPSVISYLKGENTKIPDLGQSMCPIHPSVASYNLKTGLCKACQKKAKAIGVEDRHLTKKELTALRKPAL
jgi:hypothetical protein